MNLDNKTIEVWNRAEDCNCDVQDCEDNHKLCGICERKVIYGAHESNQPTSDFAWNIDHIVPLSKGGNDSIENLQVSHIPCNKNKGNR